MRHVSISFLWASIVLSVWGECVDDPSFNIGYGDCSTYGAGGRNQGYCASDGAVTKCLRSCGSCGTAPGGSSSGGIYQNGQCMLGSSSTCASGLTCRGISSSSMYGTCQPATTSCGVYEIMSNCGTACEQKCGVQQTFCNTGSCNSPGCACASGFARYNGQCVVQSQCPQQPQQQQPQPQQPPPQQQPQPQQPPPQQSQPQQPPQQQQPLPSGQFTPNVNGVVGTKTCSTHEMCGTQNYCFSCTQCFLAVGYANSKTMCGGCYANPLSPLPSNCAPISSCASRKDSINGQCPNWGNAPSCGKNEVFVACASNCEPVCGQADSVCNTACASSKCQCLSGYRRNGNQCVLPFECPSPAPTCGPNEVFLQCSSMCEKACGQAPTTCPALCGAPKCQCASGYVRMGSQCVLPYQCPPAPQPDPTCGPNEIYATCSSLCEPKCGENNMMCATVCGPAKCQCASGYSRYGSQCVPASSCPQAGPGAPPDVGAPGNCPPDTCTLYCSQGRVKDSNGCDLCQCVTQNNQQTDPCTPNPCPITQSCVPLSFNCNTFPCQKYTCVGKTGGKPQGATCISSTECQSFHICYMGPFASMGLCLPGSG